MAWVAEVLRFRGWEFERKYSLSKLIKDLPPTLKKKSMQATRNPLLWGVKKISILKWIKVFFFQWALWSVSSLPLRFTNFKCSVNVVRGQVKRWCSKSHQTHLFFFLFFTYCWSWLSLCNAAGSFRFWVLYLCSSRLKRFQQVLALSCSLVAESSRCKPPIKKRSEWDRLIHQLIDSSIAIFIKGIKTKQRFTSYPWQLNQHSAKLKTE